ncbi:MAG: hypothetical protein R2705_24300 [Ilumatobacteraceae bacterium]
MHEPYEAVAELSAVRTPRRLQRGQRVRPLLDGSTVRRLRARARARTR